MSSNQATRIELTVVRSGYGCLSKTLYLSQAGELIKKANLRMSRGESEVVAVYKMADLARIINSLDSYQALILGVPLVDGSVKYRARIGSKRYITEHHATEHIERSKEFFQYVKGKPALLLFDIDNGKDTVTDAWNKLCQVDPSLTECGYTVTHSNSSHIYHENGTKITGTGGLHFYVAAEDGWDIPRYGKAFAEKCWLCGFGHIMISKAGTQLERCLIDAYVFTPERLVFEAPPVLQPGLVQKKSPASSSEGCLLKTQSFDLSAVQKSEVERLVRKAKEERHPETIRVRDGYVQKQAIIVSKEKNIPLADATRDIRRSLETDVLYGNQPLKFDDLGLATVNEVLDNPSRFNDQTLADPLEHDYGAGRNLAIFYASKDGNRPHSIITQAHGGKKYRLQRTAQKKSFLPSFENKQRNRFIYNIKAFINFALADPDLDPETISRRILASLFYKKNSGKERPAFTDFVERRGIRNLIHFTRIENVPMILSYGLIPRHYLELEAIRIAIRPFFADNRMNADRTHNLLSISFPDYLSFHRLSKRDKSSWVVLLLSPDLLVRHECGFEETPFDSSQMGADKGIQAANRLFGDDILRKQLNLPTHFTTYPESVVHEFSVVAPSYIDRIHVYDKRGLEKVVAMTRKKNLKTEVRVDTTFFKERMDAYYWKDLA